MIEKVSKQFAFATAIVATFAVPIVMFAQAPPARTGQRTGLQNMVGEAGSLIQALIPIVIGLGVLVFLWGVLQYVIAKDDSGKEQGRTFMLWGIIALFVMVSVWGLVNILRETLNLNNATPSAPGIPRVGGGN